MGSRAGPRTPCPLLPISFTAASAGWSCDLPQAREHGGTGLGYCMSHPRPPPQGAPALRKPWGPSTAFLTDLSPYLPHLTLGVEFGGGGRPWEGELAVPAACSQQMVLIKVK